MSLDSHIWAFEYEQISQYLKAAKYAQEFHHYRNLSKYLAKKINRDYDYVTNVPTSKKHLKQRGFDHSEYLAKLISKQLKIPYKAMLDQAHEFVQVKSSNQDRHKVPRYICKQNISGLRILLIDDVATTKTSLNRSALALKNCGAKRVDGATLAFQALKGKNPQKLLRKMRTTRTKPILDTSAKNMI